MKTVNSCNILVISTKGIGDFIGLIRALKYLDSVGAYYDLVLRNNGADSFIEVFSLKNMDKVLIWNEKNGKLHALIQLIKLIRKKYYDLAVATFPAGAKEVLMLRFARAKTKRIIRNKDGFFRFVQFLFPFAPVASNEKHFVEYNALMLNVPIEVLKPKTTILASSTEKLIGFHISAGGKGKMWPLENWAELARLISQKFSAKFYIIAGPREQNLVDQVTHNFPAPYTPLIGVDFTKLTDMIKNFSLLIGNDSSIAHLSALIGIPTVVIWGYANYFWSSPYGENVYVITRNYDCIPCYKVAKGYVERCKYNFRCIRNTKPHEVFSVVNSILSSSSMPHRGDIQNLPGVCEVKVLNSGAKIIKFCDG